MGAALEGFSSAMLLAEQATPNVCLLWDNVSAVRVLQTFVAHAILANCPIDYLLDPVLWHADWYDVLEARRSAGVASIKAILQCESNEQLRSFDVEEFDDCHSAIAYLVDQCSTNKESVRQVHEFTTPVAHVMRDYPPSVVCAAVSDRRYGEEPPLSEFWNDPRHLLRLVMFPSLARPAYDYECSFPPDLVEFRRVQNVEIVNVLDRFRERVTEMHAAVEQAEGDTRKAIRDVILQYTRVFTSLRVDRLVMFFSLYVYKASPEKRRALYQAITARKDVLRVVREEVEEFVAESSSLPDANTDVSVRWSVGSGVSFASDLALVNGFRENLAAGSTTAHNYDLCTLAVRMDQYKSTQAFPVSQTCTRSLAVPPYDSWELFEHAMDVFLENAGAFTMH